MLFFNAKLRKKNRVQPDRNDYSHTELTPFVALDEKNQRSQRDQSVSSFTFEEMTDRSNDAYNQKRRASCVLNIPVRNIKIAKRLQFACIRLKGVFLWKMMIKDIKTYGTGTCLFGVHGTYKKNISSIVQNNQMSIDNSNVVAVTKHNIIYPNSMIKKI